MKLNPAWCQKIKDALACGEIDVTLSFNTAKQWLIRYLVEIKRPYKIKSLGAGVSQITTGNVDKCPLCGSKL